jgi:hypothetical protein
VFLVLLVGELQGWTVRPWPPFWPTLVGFGSAKVLGPTRGRVARVSCSPPFFENSGGTSPMPPGRGLRPLHPRLPTLVGLGFAGVLGPTRGGVADVDYSPPFKVLWGDTPHNPPARGLRPLDPRFPTPVGQRSAGVLDPTRGGVAKVGNSPLLFVLWGDTPHTPRHGGFASWPPLSHPRGLRVCRRFGSHSWWGC